MKAPILVLAALGIIGFLPAHAQFQPKIQLELGYFHSWHQSPTVERSAWIQVPSSWQDGQSFPGQSEHSHRFRDTTWTYRFNSHHPIFTTRVTLHEGAGGKSQVQLIQALMLNSWHQLSFMLGGEWAYQHSEKWTSGLQLGMLSGYQGIHELTGAWLHPIDGAEGGVILGGNYTLTYTMTPHWLGRFYFNHAIAGLGLMYRVGGN